MGGLVSHVVGKVEFFALLYEWESLNERRNFLFFEGIFYKLMS